MTVYSSCEGVFVSELTSCLMEDLMQVPREIGRLVLFRQTGPPRHRGDGAHFSHGWSLFCTDASVWTRRTHSVVLEAVTALQ